MMGIALQMAGEREFEDNAQKVLFFLNRNDNSALRLVKDSRTAGFDTS